MNDNKLKSTEKSKLKAANSEMEPKQREKQTKSTAKLAGAIPMPYWNTNMDVNNNTNTSPSTTNEDKNNDRDGVRALKRGRQNSKEKLAPIAEELLSPPPQKKPPNYVDKGMEQKEKHAIFQSPPAVPSFYRSYAGHSFPHPQAYYGYPSWTPLLSASARPPSPDPMPITMTLPPSPPFQHHEFGWFGPNDEAENEQSLMEGMLDPTDVGNTNMDLSQYQILGLPPEHFWTSNFIEMKDQSNYTDSDKNGQTSSSSGSSSTANSQVQMLMPKMPITPKPQFGTPHPIFCPPPFGHPTQFPFLPRSTGHFPMPIYQKINKDIKHSKDATKNGIYRNCLVCGEKNRECGKYTKPAGFQVCDCCRLFFKKIVESGIDKTATFKCTKGSGNCLISKKTRNSCNFCRFQACLKAGKDRQKVIELKAKREREKQKAPSSASQNVCNQQQQAEADQATSQKIYKHDYNKTLGFLNKLCISFKAFHLHRRSTEGSIKLDELKKDLCGFMASIFEDIDDEQCKELVERKFSSFLVIRHVFLDDMPTLKEYCAWNWSKQQETDGPKADNLEKEQMDLLMHKVDKFRRDLTVSGEFLQAEEQAVLSALALSYPKFVESDKIKNVHAQLKECLYVQTFVRNPNKFNYKAYNAMKRNLEELLQ